MGVNNADYDDDGEVDYANQTIEDTSNYTNMQEFTVKAEPSCCPADKATAVLKLTDSADKDHTRVFDQNDSAVIGPDKGATYEIPHSDWGSAMTYHAEALNKSKTAHLKLEIRDANQDSVYADTLRLHTIGEKALGGAAMGSLLFPRAHRQTDSENRGLNEYIMAVKRIGPRHPVPGIIEFPGIQVGPTYELYHGSDKGLYFPELKKSSLFQGFVFFLKTLWRADPWSDDPPTVDSVFTDLCDSLGVDKPEKTFVTPWLESSGTKQLELVKTAQAGGGGSSSQSGPTLTAGVSPSPAQQQAGQNGQTVKRVEVEPKDFKLHYKIDPVPLGHFGLWYFGQYTNSGGKRVNVDAKNYPEGATVWVTEAGEDIDGLPDGAYEWKVTQNADCVEIRQHGKNKWQDKQVIIGGIFEPDSYKLDIRTTAKTPQGSGPVKLKCKFGDVAGRMVTIAEWQFKVRVPTIVNKEWDTTYAPYTDKYISECTIKLKDQFGNPIPASLEVGEHFETDENGNHNWHDCWTGAKSPTERWFSQGMSGGHMTGDPDGDPADFVDIIEFSERPGIYPEISPANENRKVTYIEQTFRAGSTGGEKGIKLETHYLIRCLGRAKYQKAKP